MSYVFVCLPQVGAVEFLEIRKFQHLPIVVIEELADGGKHHVMQADFLEDAPEGVVVHILVDDLGRVRIAEALQRFLHVVPLEFDA